MRATNLGVLGRPVRRPARNSSAMPPVAEEADAPVLSSADIRRATVLGGIDGLITTFVIVATALTGKVKPDVVGTVGVASLFADAFSMGVSEYLSSRFDRSSGDAAVLGAACALAFCAAGALPLCAYLLTMSDELVRQIAPTAVFVVSLFALGLARLLVYRGTWQYVLEVVLSGSIAGGIAFGVAYGL